MTSELPGTLLQLQPILTIVNKKINLTRSCYNPSADCKQIAIHFCGFPYSSNPSKNEEGKRVIYVIF